MTEIARSFYVPIYRTTFYVAYADTVERAVELSAKKWRLQVHPKQVENMEAATRILPSGILLVFQKSPRILRNMVHEVNHAAIFTLEEIGVKIDCDNSEVFCYFSDWLFGEVHKILKPVL
jgi:hypothetical protein